MNNILTLETKKYAIKIENFEGPLDLLCHLIEKNKLNICEVKISEITDQYIDYINNIGIDKISKYEHELREYLVSKLRELDYIEIYNEEYNETIKLEDLGIKISGKKVNNMPTEIEDRKNVTSEVYG